jgi:hypothetical protein
MIPPLFEISYLGFEFLQSRFTAPSMGECTSIAPLWLPGRPPGKDILPAEFDAAPV